MSVSVKGNWSREANIAAAHQIPVENPVGMEVMDPIQNLIQERFHHPSGQLHGLLVGLGGAVELDDVLRGRERFQSGLSVEPRAHQRLLHSLVLPAK